MVVNPDPKPGRWLLPLAVLAMFAFTFMFVRALPEAEVEEVQPITTVAPSTTEGSSADEESPEQDAESGSADQSTEEDGSGDGPTTTTLPPAVVSYLASIEALGEQLTALATEVRETNDAWDAQIIGYAEAEQRLVAVMDDIIAWQDNVILLNAPSILAASHQDMLAASTQAAVAATTVVEGLRSSDTGETRRAAAADFNTATSIFASAVQRAKSTIGS